MAQSLTFWSTADGKGCWKILKIKILGALQAKKLQNEKQKEICGTPCTKYNIIKPINGRSYYSKITPLPFFYWHNLKMFPLRGGGGNLHPVILVWESLNFLPKAWDFLQNINMECQKSSHNSNRHIYGKYISHCLGIHAYQVYNPHTSLSPHWAS